MQRISSQSPLPMEIHSHSPPDLACSSRLPGFGLAAAPHLHLQPAPAVAHFACPLAHMVHLACRFQSSPSAVSDPFQLQVQMQWLNLPMIPAASLQLPLRLRLNLESTPDHLEFLSSLSPSHPHLSTSLSVPRIHPRRRSSHFHLPTQIQSLVTYHHIPPHATRSLTLPLRSGALNLIRPDSIRLLSIYHASTCHSSDHFVAHILRLPALIRSIHPHHQIHSYRFIQGH